MALQKFFKFAASLTLIVSCATVTRAQVTVLTFEGLDNFAEISDSYAGGAGGNYGISFMPGALSLISSSAGGSGNFESGSSGVTIAFFIDSTSAVMNVAGGFSDGFSFYYAAFQPGSVTVYDGPDATGNVLTSLNLAQTVLNGTIESWHAIGVSFSGTAYSVSFGGAANQIGFDDITIGSAVAGGAIPEPSTYAALLGAATLLGVWSVRLRRSSN